MEALRYIFSVIACMAFLWGTPNSGRATEQIGIPSFHRVLVVNDTARPVVAEMQSGLITAILETQQADGCWRAVGKLRAPTRACTNPEISEGEVWQFLIPDFGTGDPAIVRLAVGISDETIYSQPFAVHLDPLMGDIDVNCWLARIRPAHTNQDPIMAAAENKPGG